MVSGTVVIFVPTFNVGGVEKNAVFAANALAGAGVRTHFVYARATGPQFALLDPRVVLHCIEPLFTSRHLNQHATDALSCLPQTVRYLRRLRREGPVAVLSFQSNLTALLAAKIARARVLVRISNHPSAVTIGGGLTPRISQALKCVFYRFADRVIANSEENAACYRTLLKREVGVVYTPSSTWLPHERTQPEALHSWLADKTLPVVVGAGRLAREKDFATLIRAFAQAVQTVPARLIVFGEGRLRAELEALAQTLGVADRVSLPGYCQDCARQVAQADLFVLSSLYEGLPNVLVEAVCAGTPCVSTRCQSGPTEILLDGAGGDLVPPEDVAALGQAIVRNLSDRAYALAHRDAARAACERFHPDAITQDYLRIARAMLSQDAPVTPANDSDHPGTTGDEAAAGGTRHD